VTLPVIGFAVIVPNTACIVNKSTMSINCLKLFFRINETFK